MSQTTRIIGAVDADEWRLSSDLESVRARRLMEGWSATALLAHVLSDADRSANNGRIRLTWEGCDDHPGQFSRIVAQIPLTETVFDQLLNGRCGYRAQYYLSPEEGILFNRDIVTGLIPAIETAYQRQPLEVSFSRIADSLQAPHSKICVFEEKDAFDQAGVDILNPPRWVDNNATRGRRVPLPPHNTIEVKGSFIGSDSSLIYVDPIKLDRAWDLFQKGFS